MLALSKVLSPVHLENMEELIKNKDTGGAKKDQRSAAENVVDTSSKRARQGGSESPPPSRLFFKKSMSYNVHVHAHL